MVSDLPRLIRYDAWVRRLFPLPLSTGMKIAQAPWKDAEDLAGYSDWAKLAAANGGRDPHIIRVHMVRALVDEVVIAAGGIEREVQTLQAAHALANADTGWIPNPVPRPEMGPMGCGPPGAALHSAYAAMNALTWIRTVQERIQRTDPVHTAPWSLQRFRRLIAGKWFSGSQPKRSEPAGLLAALKDGVEPKTTIEAEFKKLGPKLKDARKFDNYVLHGGALHGGGTPHFHVRPDRTVYFPFPDNPNTRRIFTWEEFRYKQERDALSYFEDQFNAVATFIDSMLDAFDALP